MTAKAFVEYLEGYYGAYPRPSTRTAVFHYAVKYSETDLTKIAKQISETVSTQFRYTPDIEAIETAVRVINTPLVTGDQIRKLTGREALLLAEETDEEELPVGDVVAGLAAVKRTIPGQGKPGQSEEDA